MIEWLQKALGRAPSRDTAEAFAAHDSGDWTRAAVLLEPLARQRPDDAQLLYRLGDALYQLDRLHEALPVLERAAQLAPAVAAHHYKLGNVLKDLDRGDAALACYRRALELDPRHAQALTNTGVVLETRGENDSAIDHYRRAVAIAPSLVPARRNLAMLLYRTARHEEAVESFQALLETAPDFADDWLNLANACQELGRYDQAARCCERAISLEPRSFTAHFRLGIALLHLGRFQAAEAAARRAAEISPGHVINWINLGDTLQAQRRFGEALGIYERALVLDPVMPELLNNIGTAYRHMHALDKACHYFERALACAPGYTLSRINLASTRISLGLVGEAAADCRKILENEPLNEHAARLLLMAQLYDRTDADELFEEHLTFGRRFGSGTRPAPKWPTAAGRGKKLRVGYVSSDLREHAVGYALAPIIQHHDRGAFEIYLYSSAHRPDDASRRFRELSDAWREIAELSDEAAADLIRRDKIDILVLLAGRSDENRPLLALHRPAPIQVSLHDPATSGLAEMDYLIADRSMVPRHGVEKFTERVACLPTFYVHPPLGTVRPPAAPPATTNGWITFGSFNNPAKIGPAVVALWALVLQAVPDSKLLLKYMGVYSIPEVRTRYLHMFGKHGIAADRLLLSDQPADGRGGHLDRYGSIDIALDPFPYNGTTTTFEALGMGVPVLTLLGESMRARMSVSMLRKVGLGHLVAGNEGQYVEIARALASDLEALADLRTSLRERVARSPLCAERARTRQFERLYRRMWAIHAAGSGKRQSG